jgi:hypothetical protein
MAPSRSNESNSKPRELHQDLLRSPLQQLFEFTSHAQGQARIKLTGARDLSIRSSPIVDLAPASLLHQIRMTLKKIQAASLG